MKNVDGKYRRRRPTRNCALHVHQELGTENDVGKWRQEVGLNDADVKRRRDVGMRKGKEKRHLKMATRRCQKIYIEGIWRRRNETKELVAKAMPRRNSDEKW